MIGIKLARVSPRAALALQGAYWVADKIFGAAMFLMCLAAFGLIGLILLGVVGP